MSPSLAFPLLCLILIGATLGYVDFNYHNYEQVTNILHYVHSQYPNLTHVYSIGKSVMGKVHFKWSFQSPHEVVTWRQFDQSNISIFIYVYTFFQ
jgi:hypothetical protein